MNYTIKHYEGNNDPRINHCRSIITQANFSSINEIWFFGWFGTYEPNDNTVAIFKIKWK